jgi:ribosomal protein S18 acetylase RimI-like enzyme
LLIKRNVIDFEIIDELFSYRFFESTNNPVIQDVKLGKYKHTYDNLFELHEGWRDFRILHNKSEETEDFCLSNYYDIGKGYEFSPLLVEELPEVLNIQNEVDKALKNPEHFVVSPKKRFVELHKDTKNLSLCIRKKNDKKKNSKIIGFCNLTLSKYADQSYFANLKDVNKDKILYFRTIFISPAERNKRIHRPVIKHFIKHAIYGNYEWIVCTVHPENTTSLKNFSSFNFKTIDVIDTKYGKRNVMAYKVPETKRSIRKLLNK